jgi:hypothetical protein
MKALRAPSQAFRGATTAQSLAYLYFSAEIDSACRPTRNKYGSEAVTLPWAAANTRARGIHRQREGQELKMKRSSTFCAVLAASSAVMFVSSTLADQEDQLVFSTHLTGYEETPQTLNTTGSGDFRAVVSSDGTSITYKLTYRDLSSTALQAHIHFGRPATSGGIVLWLCANNPPITPPASIPTPQPCPPFPATITGTLTAADVVASPTPGQGIQAGAAGLAEMIAAMRVGAAYPNIHTTVHPGGEIRGRLGPATNGEDN